jgi:ATP-dependent DNA helicase DinG
VAGQSVPDIPELLGSAVEGVGGEPRPGQLAMSEAVATTMREGGHLLVQAGTGTGKSLAYLVPALRHALVEDARPERSEDGDDERQPPSTGPVVVATATIALQRQLVERDLPKLTESLAPVLPRTPSFAILKGRRNYLCLQRFHAGPDDSEQGELFGGGESGGSGDSGGSGESKPSGSGPVSLLGREIMRIGEWAAHTDTGDRDELLPGVSERAWGQVAVSSRECLGATNCAYGTDCFAERARMRAMRSDVVVTNHALLAIDALGDVTVLPEHEVVVIDEAHELVDRVTGVATEDPGPGADPGCDRAGRRPRAGGRGGARSPQPDRDRRRPPC